MRHCILVLAALLAGLAVAGQANYEIFSFSGKVEVQKGTQWVPAAKLTPLSAATQIRLGAKSGIGIREAKSGLLYQWDAPGEASVIAIVSEVKKQKDGLVKQVNAYAADQLRNTANAAQGNQLAVLGGSSRGKELQDRTDSVYFALRQAVGACREGTALRSGPLSLQCIDQGKKKPVAGGAPAPGTPYYFRIANDGQAPLCVNVVRIQQEVQPQICFDLGYTYDEPFLIILPGTRLDMDQFVFVNERNDDCRYLLFGCRASFDSKQLRQLLSSDIDAPQQERTMPLALYSLPGK